MDHTDTPTPDLIDQIYRLQTSLKMLAEQLARQPEQRADLKDRALDYLYLTNWYLESGMALRRH